MGEGYKPSANNGEKHVDINVRSSNDDNHNDIQCSSGNAIVPMPVKSGAYGEGLPYAPENWPCVGDKWKWKVGKRMTQFGHWVDKALQPPKHLPNLPASGWFRSRVSLQQYIEKEFPDADVNAFFSSFIHQVPASDDCVYELKLSRPKVELANGLGMCKVGNRNCQNRSRSYVMPPISCDICCSEPGFCRDCCCILCSKPIEFSNEGLNFIKCEAPMLNMFICGHVAHIHCALRAHLAGKVSGTIDLDVQYFCRRCDNKTDLLPHVDKIIKFCVSIDDNGGVMAMLSLGLCLLQKTERESAKYLEDVITELMVKHKVQ